MGKPVALIIEDDRDIAALFRHVLDIAGYETDIVLHGKQALKHLASMRPDIVLLDLHLPGIPGEQILKHIRSEERLKEVPVVVVTAHSEIADQLSAEADLVLLKPVNLEQLSILVQRLRTTSASMQETPWDSVTHLYNRSFFTVRLTYSLERLRQTGLSHFGVLFAYLEPFASLQEEMDGERINTLLKGTGSHLKAILRPTDTTAHFGNGFFLVLLEDFADPNVATKIAKRVELELSNYLLQAGKPNRLQVCVGVLLCEAGYGNAEEILRDVELARTLVKNDDYILYNREILIGRRSSPQNSGPYTAEANG